MNHLVIVEKWAQFVLTENGSDIRLLANEVKPVGGRVYRVRISVPGELIGTTKDAEVSPE